jgi:hypothetical protein
MSPDLISRRYTWDPPTASQRCKLGRQSCLFDTIGWLLGRLTLLSTADLCSYEGDDCDMDEIQVSVAFNMLPEPCR